MPAKKKKKPEFKVGQRVFIPIGPNQLEAQVVEDLGTLGVNGERVYSVLVFGSEDRVSQRDAAESHLIPAA